VSPFDPTARFRERARAYARGRPGYPPELLDVLAQEVGLGAGDVVADVGSGTGILTRMLLARGCVVHAVEPNEEMRRAAEAALAGRPAFHSHAGRAEATGLPDACVAGVTAAQAFHWFEPQATRREWRRILRPGGWAALVWNERREAGTPFLEAYEAFLRAWGTDYAEVRSAWDVAAVLPAFFADGRWSERSLANAQELDRESLAGRVESSSYMPAAGHARHADMRRALEALFAAHARGGRGGTVRIEYDTRVYLGRMRAEGGDAA
jgi:SAM-dependent methyltransferase